MSQTAAPPAPEPKIPWLGLAAVLLGTFVSTLTGRLSSFGLADVRGGIHAGFDEGAWITTSFTAAQMLVTPFAVWIGSIYGPRRVLIVTAVALAFSSFLTPFSPNLNTLLVLQFCSGLASGCFIPLTLSFILRNMPMRLWAYGIALYALNLELSLNISASMEGWFDENLSWHWIFWQNVPLALLMAACLHWGVRHLPPPPEIHWDPFGLATCGVGFALIYAALDQGNRLNWLDSGLVWGLMLAGVMLVAAFLIHESTIKFPWVDLRVALKWPMPALLLMISILRFTIQGTAIVIPYYLGGVRGFRALQIGGTLLWIAAPQFLLCFTAAVMLRLLDARIVASLGMALIGIACLWVAYTLTPQWGSDEFFASQLVQAVGQSLALSGVVFYGILHLRPQDALSFGAFLQIARLFGGQMGAALLTTFNRVREQRASNLIGQHVQTGAPAVQQRLAAYAHLLAQHDIPSSAAASLLAGAIRTSATTQAAIDGFVLVAAAAGIALFMFILVVPTPPVTPASPIPFFRRQPR